ncbi:hypothetical protein AWZ03_007702 [Drosophila navojoa]|uniref:Uncharacterized protein n=1 Tax=Drosophila navojoa TaxID=7232 RepID=A0A484BAG1_DRONA|nr:hypothetical protein AWZ03_007702 [Drosophila navojoa]
MPSPSDDRPFGPWRQQHPGRIPHANALDNDLHLQAEPDRAICTVHARHPTGMDGREPPGSLGCLLSSCLG